jgi:hypothetical protein
VERGQAVQCQPRTQVLPGVWQEPRGRGQEAGAEHKLHNVYGTSRAQQDRRKHGRSLCRALHYRVSCVFLSASTVSTTSRKISPLILTHTDLALLPCPMTPSKDDVLPVQLHLSPGTVAYFMVCGTKVLPCSEVPALPTAPSLRNCSYQAS